MMRRMNLALALLIVGTSAAVAQQRSDNPAWVTPRFDLSLGYNNIRANAPPGSCNCFGLNGGYASAAYHLTDWLSIAGEITGSHANNISLLGQNLTLTTFMAGPRVSREGHRIVPYGQFLLGGAHGGDSYFPSRISFSSSASKWALSTGGGLDVNLTHRFAVRAIEVQYMRTTFPNGTNDAQNHLVVGAGLVIKFGGRDGTPPPPPPAHIEQLPREIPFTCSTSVSNVAAGEMVEITGNTMTEPDKLEVSYSWSSSGGTVQGSGRRVTIDTTDLPPGDYHVTGHASLVTNAAVNSDCLVSFKVNQHSAPPPPPAPVEVAAPAPPPVDNAKLEEIFHENVKDILFDYNSAKIRADQQVNIDHAVEYLKANPEIGVLVHGYADQRGSIGYNLTLGEQRANAARNALITGGIDANRLEIISYGKNGQICTAGNETCWQQNRRAAFAMRH